jgi:hypothetical protein
MVLLPPAQVRRYVLRSKTDRTDTKGLLEAGLPPDFLDR